MLVKISKKCSPSKQVVTSRTGLRLLLSPQGGDGVEGLALWVSSPSDHLNAETFGGFLQPWKFEC